MPKSPLYFVLPLAAALTLTACGSDTKDPAASQGSSTSAATSQASTTTAATTKVSANNASIDELATALNAAGVPAADRWAREVDEYRPYDESDTNFNKLRDNLDKYDPAPETVELIVSALSLP